MLVSASEEEVGEAPLLIWGRTVAVSSLREKEEKVIKESAIVIILVILFGTKTVYQTDEAKRTGYISRNLFQYQAAMK